MAARADLEWSSARSLSFDDSSEDSDEPSRTPANGGLASRIARVVAAGTIAGVMLLGARSMGASQLSFSPKESTRLSDQGALTAATATEAAATVAKHAASNVSVIPLEHKNDGNPCNEDEEYMDGVCYGKCSLLSNGEYPFRKSAWTCCKQEDCGSNLFKVFSCCNTNMGLCSGFDIAGMQEGNKICPHKPGACLADEELFLNICYMKCSLLTNGAYPYRSAAGTCCKTTGISCMVQDGVKDGIDGMAITNSSLAVGGGCGDHTELTKCEPHPPSVSLTES